MDTKLRKAEDLKIDSKVFKKFESYFKKEVDAVVSEDRFNNDDFDPWRNTDRIIGTLYHSDIIFTDEDNDSVAVPIDCFDTSVNSWVDGGFINVQNWK